MHKINIDEVLSREMDRKDFLRYAGLAALGVLGVNNLIKNLSSFGKTKQRRNSSYSGNAYGG